MANKVEEKIQDLDNKMCQIIKEIKEFKQSMSFFNKNFEEYKKEIKEILNNQKDMMKENKVLRDELFEVKNECKTLRAEYEYCERIRLSTGLEIAGIPERPQENLSDVIMEIAKIVGIPMDKKSIMKVERIGKKKIEREKKQNYPESVVLKVNSKELRDNFLKEVKKRRLTSEEIGFGRKYNIFVKEELTFYGKQLFYKCLEFKRITGWKYLWTKDARIFLRQKEGDKCYLINNQMELDALKK